MRIIILTMMLTVALTTSIARGNTFQYFNGPETRDEFFAAVDQLGPTTTIDFVGLRDMETIDDQYEDLGILFSGQQVFSYQAPNLSDGFGLVAGPFVEMTFSEPQYWFAADFLGSGNDADFYWEDELLLETNFPLIFTGIIMDKPFDRVVFYDPGDDVAAIDNIFFGAPVTVPAPGALVILLGGMTIGQSRRRRGEGNRRAGAQLCSARFPARPEPSAWRGGCGCRVRWASAPLRRRG